MTRQTFFSDHQILLMHLSSIGSVGIGAEHTPNVPFHEQPVTAIIVESAPIIRQETLDMALNAGLSIQAVDFELGQLVLVPMSDPSN